MRSSHRFRLHYGSTGSCDPCDLLPSVLLLLCICVLVSLSCLNRIIQKVDIQATNYTYLGFFEKLL